VDREQQHGDHGRGIYSFFDLTLLNVTLSGNTATSSGGGLQVGGGDATVIATTIAHNAAPSGSGLTVEGNARLRYVLLANDPPEANCSTTIIGICQRSSRGVARIAVARARSPSFVGSRSTTGTFVGSDGREFAFGFRMQVSPATRNGCPATDSRARSSRRCFPAGAPQLQKPLRRGGAGKSPGS